MGMELLSATQSASSWQPASTRRTACIVALVRAAMASGVILMRALIMIMALRVCGADRTPDCPCLTAPIALKTVVHEPCQEVFTG